jgi:hypothetical protein
MKLTDLHENAIDNEYAKVMKAYTNRTIARIELQTATEKKDQAWITKLKRKIRDTQKIIDTHHANHPDKVTESTGAPKPADGYKAGLESKGKKLVPNPFKEGTADHKEWQEHFEDGAMEATLDVKSHIGEGGNALTAKKAELRRLKRDARWLQKPSTQAEADAADDFNELIKKLEADIAKGTVNETSGDTMKVQTITAPIIKEEHSGNETDECTYCGTARGSKMSCCGEVHFDPVEDTEDAPVTKIAEEFFIVTPDQVRVGKGHPTKDAALAYWKKISPKMRQGLKIVGESLSIVEEAEQFFIVTPTGAKVGKGHPTKDAALAHWKKISEKNRTGLKIVPESVEVVFEAVNPNSAAYKRGYQYAQSMPGGHQPSQDDNPYSSNEDEVEDWDKGFMHGHREKKVDPKDKEWPR